MSHVHTIMDWLTLIVLYSFYMLVWFDLWVTTRQVQFTYEWLE